jgi:hypothetical protein
MLPAMIRIAFSILIATPFFQVAFRPHPKQGAEDAFMSIRSYSICQPPAVTRPCLP